MIRKTITPKQTATAEKVTAFPVKNARADAQAEARAGELAERARCAAILTAPEAEGREDLAQQLALETDLPPETCIRILGAAPKARVQSSFEKNFGHLTNGASRSAGGNPLADMAGRFPPVRAAEPDEDENGGA
jgi:hypothetical protein